MNITITLSKDLTETGDRIFIVKAGVMELARVSFDGPRNTIRTHSGALHAEERKTVYRLHDVFKRA